MIVNELGTLLIKYEHWRQDEGEIPTLMVSIYTKEGDYVGSIDPQAVYIVNEKAIMPEKADSKNKVCTIGKSLRDGKWYGWSHRAIYGFGIDEEVKEGDLCATTGWSEDHLSNHPEDNKSLPVGFIAKTEEDCKKMAIAFAEAVG